MSSLKTIILKYLLVCVFLVSPCCVHRDRRPDLTVSVVPSPRFVLFVFSSVFFVPGFLSLLLAVRGSLRRRSRLSHPAVRGTSCPPFAGVYAAVRGSPIPLFAGVLAAVRGSAIPPFAGSWRRRSRLCHPAVRGSSRRRSRINQPSVHWRWRHHPRLTLARRPASDSMPAGLPLTQCPPACLWLNARRPASDSSSPGVPLTQARRIAADSSSPDCRWLKLAGLPLTHATGRRQGRPTHHCRFHAAVRGPPVFHVLLLRGESQPAVRGSLGPQPVEAPSSPPAPAVEWSSQPAAAVIVKPAGYGLASRPLPNLTSQPAVAEFDQSVTTVFLTVFVCSPRRAPGTPKLPHGNFLGGVQGSRLLGPGRGTRPRPPWTTGLGLLSSLLHLGLRLFVPLWRSRPVYVSVSVLRGLQSAHPPSPVELLRLGSSLPGGGSYVRVMLEFVLCVSCVPASCFLIWFVSCHY